MAESYSIVFMHHYFVIHSSTDGHLGCFRALATVINAAINVQIHLLFGISLDKLPEVALLSPSLSLVIDFILKSILTGVSIVTPAFCRCFYFHEIFLPFLYFLSLCVCLI